MTGGTLRIGFWNAWLLRPRLWSGGPVVPVIGEKLAPRVAERAPLIGAALRGRFDVVALAECFEAEEQQAVAAAWPGSELVVGPTRRGARLTGSGLITLADPGRVEVVHTARHAFRSGGDLRDSDTFATKGALLTRIRLRPGGPELDLVSTHLIAGGDLLPLPGAEDSVRHHAARMRQVDELISFVERERRPSVPVLVAGDFNVQRHNPRLADPAADHDDLAVRMRRPGFADLWAEHGVGPGHSCTFTDAAQLPPDPDEPDLVADDPDGDSTTELGGPERIDYLWLAPALDGSVGVRVERPRRWAFAGRGVRGGPAGSLSDHLALSVTLHLS